MLDQETLYQHIAKEQWTEIVRLLYTHRSDISSDPLLQRSATIFEQEFFKQVNGYAINRKDIEEVLDTLYILNHKELYELTTENYKKLIIELVRRKPLKEATNYAQFFPDEEICSAVIAKSERQRVQEENIKLSSPHNLPINWIEIYNRLFELINNKNDTATYFSGPRFINTIREFEPYFPDYNQFIDQRNREGKSTSRKIYYYDIFIGLSESTRLRALNRFLELLLPFEQEKVNKINVLLGKQVSEPLFQATAYIEETPSTNPVVFISYSWDDEAHKEWVLNLADRLCSDGIDVILDRYFLTAGKNLPHFVENSISKAEKIIIVFTPNYKLKADKRTGGVGYEYSIMNADLYNNQTTNEKIIPVLRQGSKEDSIPAFMQQFIHIDIRNEDNFENSYIDLLREVYNEPVIQKPKIGTKPTFKKRTADEVEKPVIGKIL